MKVPFLDLKAGYTEIQEELDNEISKILHSGQYIGGPAVQTFEENFANFVDSSYCVGLANGLDAIQISLMALGIKKGDEVIVPCHTFIATWLAVSNCGATPVPIRSNEDTYLIDVSEIEKAITNKTKAIIPVHLYGQAADLTPILNLADAYNLYVVEDAAQAHGAVYKSRKLGGHGDVVAWSFYPGKNLGAFGDAGAITTNRDDLAEKIRILGNYGSKKKYVHNVIGSNSRLDPIQATILDVKLNFLDEWNSRRVHIAQKYLMELENFNLKLPSEFNLKDSVWHIFPIRVQNRDELSKNLASDQIETLVHYPTPPYLQKAYKDDFQGFQCIRTEELTSQLLSLPIGPHLTEQEVDFVIQRVSYYCS